MRLLESFSRGVLSVVEKARTDDHAGDPTLVVVVVLQCVAIVVDDGATVVVATTPDSVDADDNAALW